MSTTKESVLGCVVNKNGGGPLMTIAEMVSENSVVCQWFDDDKLFSGTFDLGKLSFWERSTNPATANVG